MIVHPITPIVTRSTVGSIAWEFARNYDDQPRHGTGKWSVDIGEAGGEFKCLEYGTDRVAFQAEIALMPSIPLEEVRGITNFWNRAARDVGLEHANEHTGWDSLPHERRRWIFQRIDQVVEWEQYVRDQLKDSGSFRRSWNESWEITPWALTDEDVRIRDAHAVWVPCSAACRIRMSCRAFLTVVADIRTPSSPHPSQFTIYDPRTGSTSSRLGLMGPPDVPRDVRPSTVYRAYRLTRGGRVPTPPGDPKAQDVPVGTILQGVGGVSKGSAMASPDQAAAKAATHVGFRSIPDVYTPTEYAYEATIAHCPCEPDTAKSRSAAVERVEAYAVTGSIHSSYAMKGG